jgi:mono/diheme cytochrome c family protein
MKLSTLFVMFVCAVPTIGCGGSDSASSGQALTANNCGSCHDSGDGSYSGSTKSVVDNAMVYAPNLSSDPDTGIGGWTDDQVFNAVKNGIDDEGKTLCIAMPRWGRKMNDQQIHDIVGFLRTLKPVHRESLETTCPQ